MGQFISGVSRCAICGRTIESGSKFRSFAAFLPHTSRWGHLSDGSVHNDCLQKWPDAENFLAAYSEYQELWKKARSFESAEDGEKWLRERLVEFRRKMDSEDHTQEQTP